MPLAYTTREYFLKIFLDGSKCRGKSKKVNCKEEIIKN